MVAPLPRCAYAHVERPLGLSGVVTTQFGQSSHAASGSRGRNRDVLEHMSSCGLGGTKRMRFSGSSLLMPVTTKKKDHILCEVGAQSPALHYGN